MRTTLRSNHSLTSMLHFLLMLTMTPAFQPRSFSRYKRDQFISVATSSEQSLGTMKFDQAAWERGYTSCNEEVVKELEGSLPTDIEGTFFKNVPAKFEYGKDLVLHPFDADGLVLGITIKDGKALFRNRFVRTKGYVADSKRNRIVSRGTFGTRKSGFLANLFDFKFKNTANTNVLYWDKKLFALQESDIPHYMEPDSLRTMGKYRFRGLLKSSVNCFTAHPRIDSRTGYLVAFSLKSGKIPTELTMYEFDPSLKVVTSRDVKFKDFCFYHDFVVTDNYYVFVQAPASFDVMVGVVFFLTSADLVNLFQKMIFGQKSPGQCVSFDSSRPSLVHIIPRDPSKESQTIEIPTQFLFHCANAYEEDGQIVMGNDKSRTIIIHCDCFFSRHCRVG